MSLHKPILCLLTCLLLTSCNNTPTVQEVTPSEIPHQTAKESPVPIESPSIKKTSPSSETDFSNEPSYPPLTLSSDTALPTPTFGTQTPVQKHGQLFVEGTSLMDASHHTYQLRGVSTHGIQWFSQYLTPTIFKSLRDDFHINAIRLALYADYSSLYLENQAAFTAILDTTIQTATEAGLYVLIDWHILEDQNPVIHQTDAVTFFNYFSLKYQNYPNILYEICNEPNGDKVTWSDQIKPYAEEMITTIRTNDPDGIIIVGTPHWCQSPLSVSDDPIDDHNLLYAFHFYAATHGSILRSQLETSITDSHLPLIVSEFGTCEATGSGTVNLEQTQKWIELLDTYHVSWFNWSLCDKDESSALLLPGTPGDHPITEANLTESGKLIKKILLNYPEESQ